MTNLKVVLVSNDVGPMPDWVPEQLSAAGVSLEENLCQSPGETTRAAADAEIIWVMSGAKVVTTDNLPDLKKCRFLLRTGSGTDNVPVAEAVKRGIVVGNTPEAIVLAVAEHAIGMLFAVTRQIVIHDRLVRQGVWDRNRALPRWTLTGSCLGLMGFGRIAQLVARKARGLDMEVIAYDPVVDASKNDPNVQAVTREELFSRADFVSIHVPLLSKTRHLIGSADFDRMKPSAILLNTSRGPVVDESALIAALQAGKIAGAGLDVLEVEPPYSDNPLLKLDNVVLTPHIGSMSDQFAEMFWSHSVRTITAFAASQTPLWIVKPDA
ncbi:MAG: NAD(P)-dependent oxidoreductase [Planctomycetales bacterium]